MQFSRQIIVLSLFVLAFKAHALDIDEKLTGRFLSISSSKKTVLINRGLEDGLVVGDHAKFFLTEGVIARGVVVKASPSRSIWSFYRLVSPEEISSDKVINLKISSPLKLTEDPTKMLAETHSGDEAGVDVLTVPTAKGDVNIEELANNNNTSEMDELESVRDHDSGNKVMEKEAPILAPTAKVGTVYTWTLEAFGMMHFNGLSTSVDTGEGGGTSTGKQSFVDFSLGIEKYFSNRESWLHKVSFLALIHNNSQELTSLENGDAIKQSNFEYGIGVNYHFLESPFTYGRPIVYVGLNFGLGTSSDSAEITNTSTSPQTKTSQNYDGSSTFFSLGVGGKFYTRWGIGARVVLDYYRRSEEYSIDDGGQYAKVVAGPRLMAGISYRW